MPTFPTEPAYTATETTFQTGPSWAHDITNNPAFDAMQQWCRDHNIDPEKVAASYPIVRHERGISYSRIDLPNRAVVVQWHETLDREPAPWPDAIKRNDPHATNAYVVRRDYDYEGLTVEGIFATRDRAIVHARHLRFTQTSAAREIIIERWHGAELVDTWTLAEIETTS